MIPDNVGVKNAVGSSHGATLERPVGGEIELLPADKDSLDFNQQ